MLRTQGQISTRSEYDSDGRLRSPQRRHTSHPAIADAGSRGKRQKKRAPDSIGVPILFITVFPSVFEVLAAIMD
ncbi:hypothetical protein [Pseudomonas sp. AL03]|uniref:hypothetical protein n=1 Tax=Pseudomonas sp. AL03 TaxID=3042230 RepID=UPI00249B7193|nr:hypothetical protein [Pseudomonas sp. AL03]